MEAFDIFLCCMMKFLYYFAPSSELETHTHAHTAKKLVTDQETARSSSTDASTNYLLLNLEYQRD